MKSFKNFIKEEVTTEKLATGHHQVLWKGEPTKYHIFNGSAGLSGRGGNVYGIHDKETGKSTQIGSLQKAKKTVSLWIRTNEKNKVQEEVAANCVGTNPPDAVKVAGEPFKKVGNSIVNLRRNNKKERIARNQARERFDHEFQ